jgi:hypothetical protein
MMTPPEMAWDIFLELVVLEKQVILRKVHLCVNLSMSLSNLKLSPAQPYFVITMK